MKNHRANNFDFIRLVGALLVIIGHSSILTGHPAPTVMNIMAHELGVKLFFVVSGYLITQSWIYDPHLFRYLRRRCLRIFPALLACVLSTVGILGPLLTTRSLTEYFSSPETHQYLTNMVLYIRYTLPGVFEHNIYPRAVNGSLWTLPVEFVAYLAVPIFLSFHRSVIGKGLAAFAAVALIVAEFSTRSLDMSTQPVIYGMGLYASLQLWPYFGVGMMYRLFHLERFLSIQWTLVLILIVNALPLSTSILSVLQYIVVSYSILSFALASPPQFTWISKIGDLSYGMYLYAFPMQQTAVLIFGKGQSVYTNMVFTIVTSAFLAAVSWHWIEKPALALKPKRPIHP